MSQTAATTETPHHAPPTAHDTDERAFDGVVCFGGEDWWYHNRGHYDMQMMRELSARVPILYINSIGMRVPRPGEGKMFLKRVKRKLASLRRGLVRVRENFSVLSPVAAPGGKAAKLNPVLLPAQVRAAARKAGIHRPLIWINCPPGAQALDGLRHAGLVYQRTDRYEEFTGVDPERIRAYDQRLKREADLTLFCSGLLHAEEAQQCRRALFIDHGVDYDRFLQAGLAAERDPDAADPPDIRDIPRPRVGFIGGIDAHTFDPPLFVEVAKALPDVHFFLVGGCSLPADWCPLPNVRQLGQRDYADVPAYMAAADVLIMPWNQSEWIRACNPVKLKEYLAVGRPIVTTPFDELRRYEGLTRPASGADAFAAAIRAALDDAHAARFDPAPGRARVEHETWSAKAEAVLRELESMGLQARPA